MKALEKNHSISISNYVLVLITKRRIKRRALLLLWLYL